MKVLNIYFDTLFTKFHKDASLISIGLVSDYGDKFYAELTDYDKSQIDEVNQNDIINKLVGKGEGFCKSHVRDNTPIHYKGELKKDLLKVYLENWILKTLQMHNYEKIQLISYVSHYDMVLFCDIFGGDLNLPPYINAVCHDINQDIAAYCNITESEAFSAGFGIVDASGEINNNDTAEIIKYNSFYNALVIRNIFQRIYDY